MCNCGHWNFSKHAYNIEAMTERIDLGFLVHDVARMLRARFEEKAALHGISAAQWRVLVRLWKDGSMTQAKLATLLEVEPISVSRLLDRMEPAGWIERLRDPTDRRVRIVAATQKAREVQNSMRSVADDVFAEAFRGFAPQDEATLLEGLVLISKNLSSNCG